MTKKVKSLYHGHRFPAAVISCAVRWYFRFQLSLCDKFGAGFAIALSLRVASPARPGISMKYL
jgi:hypothetical protein